MQEHTLNLLFISYGRNDAGGLAEKLEEDLKKQGYRVFLDKKEIQAGTDFVAMLEDGIKNARLLVCLLSPHSVRRHCDIDNENRIDSLCLDELSYARFSARKPIIPVMVIPCEAPFVISRLDYVDMTGWKDDDRYKAGLKLLLEAIEETLQQGSYRLRNYGIDLDECDFTAYLNEKRESFVGRKWLFDKIDTWRKGQDERSLIIKGSPGTGKSAIVAQLVHFNPSGQVLAYHCCQTDTFETLKPSRFIRSLAAQISAKLKSYAALLAKPTIKSALSERRCMEDPLSSFEEGLLVPLNAIPAPDEGTRYIIIDALDEALGYRQEHTDITIIDLLVGRLDRLPPWLRLVATTRKEQAVMSKLKAIRSIDLDEYNHDNRTDIQEYIRCQLQTINLGNCSSGNNISSDVIEKTLADKSDGNFLYVVEAIKGIKRTQYTIDQLKDLPPGLGSLYQIYFERHLSSNISDVDQLRHTILNILQVVVAAQEPLTKQQLAEITEIDLEGKLSRGLKFLSSYLIPIQDAPDHIQYKLFHKSFADWLTSDDQQGSDFYISKKQGHRRLADAGWKEYENDPDQMSSYMKRYLAVHLAELNEPMQWERLLQIVQQNRLGLINRWVHNGQHQEGLTCMKGLVNYLKNNSKEANFAAGLLTQIATIFTHEGIYEISEKYLKDAMKLSSRWEGRRVRAIAQHEIGSLYFYQGNKSAAKRAYRDALWTCVLGHGRLHDEEAANLLSLATIALSQYRHRKAIRLSEKSLKKAKVAKDVRHVISSYHIMASANKDMMRYDEANTYLNTAKFLALKSGCRPEVIALDLLHGWMSFQCSTIMGGQISKAEDYFHAATMEALKLDHLWYSIEGRVGMLYCALAKKATEYAQHLLREIMTSMNTFKNYAKMAEFDLIKATVTHQLGRLDEAQLQYRKTLAESTKYDYFTIVSQAWVGLGAVQCHMKNVTEAENSWCQARSIAAKCSSSRIKLTEISIDHSLTDAHYTPR